MHMLNEHSLFSLFNFEIDETARQQTLPHQLEPYTADSCRFLERSLKSLQCFTFHDNRPLGLKVIDNP